MDIQHRPGAQHKNVDALSRYSCGQCRGKEMKSTLSALSNGNETKFNEQQQQGCVLRNETLREVQQNEKDVSSIKQLTESTKKRTKKKYFFFDRAGIRTHDLWVRKTCSLIH